ncbi:MAG TPA: alpha/beta family hydrolase [Acidimicrobiales bacterium]|nr:alpha/beta family hydrolase [Acidimicrobiales bacterium]
MPDRRGQGAARRGEGAARRGEGAARRGPTGPRCAPAGIVLTPGAGSGRDHPALVAIEEALAPRGITTRRVDFPYRLAGRRAPDRPAVLVAAVREAAAELAASLGVGTEQIALGGRSMGGRMCSVAVAEGLPAAALVLISYPLHPPGRPDRLRTEHFGELRVPCLFVSGTRDAFGSPAKIERAAAAIPGPVTHVWLEGGDHALKRRDAEVAAVVAAWLAGP